MIISAAVSQEFPKSARLRKAVDFRFSSYRRFQSQFLVFIYTSRGKGRLGISIPKKILRRAVARNRVRRMIREVFRKNRDQLRNIDVHVMISAKAKDLWKNWGVLDIDCQFGEWLQRLDGRINGVP